MTVIDTAAAGLMPVAPVANVEEMTGGPLATELVDAVATELSGVAEDVWVAVAEPTWLMEPVGVTGAPLPV